jgi:hypothetical protein
MYRKLLIALGVVVVTGTHVLASGAEFAGPGPGITGNDTGGIFPYSPDVEGVYQQIAEDHCARWGRLAQVTSIHRKYGDYVSFVCYDRPGMIH